jgi:hypothetical protein
VENLMSETGQGPVALQGPDGNVTNFSLPEALDSRHAERIAEAERRLAEAYASVSAAGVDADVMSAAFAIARDCLAEARRSNQPVIPDMPGTDLCPDPRAVKTPAGLMETLRLYRIWAGMPSYRSMERRCGRRFAAATICTALRSNRLPSLDMVHAVVIACGGSAEHQQAFAFAWRRLVLPH